MSTVHVPFVVPTPLRFTTATSPYESLRIARRLIITSFELPRYNTSTKQNVISVPFTSRARWVTFKCRLLRSLGHRFVTFRIQLPGCKRVFRNANSTVFMSCIARRGRAVLSMNVVGNTRVIRWGDVLHHRHRSTDVNIRNGYNHLCIIQPVLASINWATARVRV